KTSTYLDGEYAAFGHVTEGMEIIDRICEEVKVVENSDGMVLKENQPIIESIKYIS
ncbi:MAG: peptidylprolyl isomerase, partial [Bacilli bacterium]|nr:peptidylprolyl isomerase [Bacilli bacterium]